MSTRISVALASYNGAAYIEEQLESLARQERLPDELIVCDDGSSDQTVEIIRTFSARAPFPVRIEENPIRLGVTKNFEKALSLCTGDLVFLADQDDVWFPSKIGTMQQMLEADTNVLMGLNDAVIVDRELCTMATSLIRNVIRTTGRLEENFFQGCCAVITRAFRDLCLPFPIRHDGSPVIGYDGSLNFVALLLDVRSVLRLPLQYYRRHEGNVSSSPAYNVQLSRYARFKYERGLLRELRRHPTGHTEGLVGRLGLVEAVLERLEGLTSRADAASLFSKIEMVQKKKRNLERRIAICRLSKGRKVAAATSFYFVGGYRGAGGMRSFLVDILK